MLPDRMVRVARPSCAHFGEAPAVLWSSMATGRKFRHTTASTMDIESAASAECNHGRHDEWNRKHKAEAGLPKTLTVDQTGRECHCKASGFSAIDPMLDCFGSQWGEEGRH